jgi:alkylation response protein AidB-like acyl-CoA dehydrogenase
MSTPRLDNRESVLRADSTLKAVVDGISAGAAERDAHPSFPEDPFRKLAQSGVLAIPVPDPLANAGADLLSPRSGACCGP